MKKAYNTALYGKTKERGEKRGVGGVEWFIGARPQNTAILPFNCNNTTYDKGA